VVAASIGLAEPFSLAVVLATVVAAEVVTAGTAAVVNESTEPKEVPTEFEAIAQK
jgi:uncharacterized membrane protein HdeD (DUF308 family)